MTLPDGTKIEELNKATAAQMVPFDSIKFTGNYGNMTEVSYQVAKRAAKKGAKYYHITASGRNAEQRDHQRRSVQSLIKIIDQGGALPPFCYFSNFCHTSLHAFVTLRKSAP